MLNRPFIILSKQIFSSKFSIESWFLNQVKTGPNLTMKAPNMNMLRNLYDVKTCLKFFKDAVLL